MITIDRSSPTSIQDQLREQLRFRIASGIYKVAEAIPSTRRLADQLDISFHTVRKVYQDLEREGILESRPGKGFIVRERVPLDKTERMERGAALVLETLQRLRGLGLSESEVEYVFQEQSSLLDSTGPTQKLVGAFPYLEMAELCAAQIERNLQQDVVGSTLENLARHMDADYVFTPHAHVRSVQGTLPRADVIGVTTYFHPDVLEPVAKLLESETLAVIARYADAIRPLTLELQRLTSFSGQILAASVDESASHIEQLVSPSDLVVYTPPARRRLLGYLKGSSRHVEIEYVVSSESLEVIRQTVPV